MISEHDCIAMAQDCGLGDIPTDALVRLCGVVEQAAREACAKLLEENAMACENPIHRSLLQANAAAIRAGGQDPMPLFDDWDSVPWTTRS